MIKLSQMHSMQRLCNTQDITHHMEVKCRLLYGKKKVSVNTIVAKTSDCKQVPTVSNSL